MRSIVSSLPTWIQSVADVAIVGLTFWTLIVLRRYAADTKRIADVSASQTERSQMPFLTVAWREAAPPQTRVGWEMQNQGFGPALSVRFSLQQPPAAAAWRSIADIASGESRQDFHNEIANFIQSQGGQNRTFSIEYSSLSGQRYKTTVDRLLNGELQTHFFIRSNSKESRQEPVWKGIAGGVVETGD